MNKLPKEIFSSPANYHAKLLPSAVKGDVNREIKEILEELK